MVAKPATPLVGNIGSPSVNTNRGTAGSVGKGLQALGKGVTSAGMTMMDRALLDAAEENERQVKEAETTYKEARLLVLHGDGTAQNPGYLSLQGQAAIDARPGVDQAILDAQSEGLKGISRKEAAQSYMSLTANDVAVSTAKANSHVSHQRKVASINTAKRRQGQARSDAAANYDQGTAEVNKYIRISISEARSAAKFAGMDDDNAEHAGWLAGSETAAAAVQAAIDSGDVLVAADLLGVYSAEGENGRAILDGAVASNLVEKLEDESVLQDSQAITAAIMSDPLTTPAQKAALSRNYPGASPRVQHAVGQAVGVQLSQNRQIEAEQRRENSEAATNSVADGTPVAELPPEVLRGLTVTERRSLEKYERDRANGKPVQENWPLFNQLTLDRTQADLANDDLGVARRHLPDGQFASYQSMVLNARANIRKGVQDPNNATRSGLLKTAFNNAGVPTSSNEAGAIATLYDAERKIIEDRNKKPMAYDEKRELLLRITDDVALGSTVDPRSSGVFRAGFGKEPVEVYAVQVPEEDQALVIERFEKDNGRAPSSLELRETYVRMTNESAGLFGQGKDPDLIPGNRQ